MEAATIVAEHGQGRGTAIYHPGSDAQARQQRADHALIHHIIFNRQDSDICWALCRD